MNGATEHTVETPPTVAAAPSGTCDPDGDDLSVTAYALLERHARERPNHPFIHCIDTRRTLSYAEVRHACNRIAAWCSVRGIKANDRIALLGGNSLEYLLIYLAVLRHGATLCAINPESVGVNLGPILDAMRPRVVLYEAAVDLQRPSDRGVEPWIAYAQWPGVGTGGDEFFSQIARCADEPAPAPVGGPDNLATIMYTSGTTGRPKGIVHHYKALFANTVGTALALEMGPDDRILEYRSFAWLSARARLMTSLYCGSTLVIAQKFSQSRFFDWVKNEGLTIAFAVPTVIGMLVNRPLDIRKEDLPCLRFVTSSTAPLAVEHQRAFEERYGIEVLQFYGISESGGLTANPPGRRKLGSVGRPSLYQDLRIVDADGTPLPAGEIGEIETGGEQVCAGYLEYDGTITPLRGKRLRTGDLGYLDQDGYLFITGRRSETINRGGVKVSPIEVDNALLSHPDVAEAATIGVPDAIYGEEIVSFVVRYPGGSADRDGLVHYCAQSLPAYKLPRNIAFVDSIPRNARAKVDRKALLDLWRQRNEGG